MSKWQKDRSVLQTGRKCASSLSRHAQKDRNKSGEGFRCISHTAREFVFPNTKPLQGAGLDEMVCTASLCRSLQPAYSQEMCTGKCSMSWLAPVPSSAKCRVENTSTALGCIHDIHPPDHGQETQGTWLEFLTFGVVSHGSSI